MFGYHSERQQLLVPCFFPPPAWLIFKQPFCKDSLFLCNLLYFCTFVSLASLPARTPVLMSCVCVITWVPKKNENWTKMYTMKIWDNSERRHAYNLQKNLGRHNARWEESWCLHQIQKEIERKMAAIKLRLCLTKWQGACSPRKLPWTANQIESKTRTGLNNNLYQCPEKIYSYKMHPAFYIRTLLRARASQIAGINRSKM